MNNSISIPEVTLGQIRIQIISDSLLRFELADASGFEDALTYNVKNRNIGTIYFDVKFNSCNIRIKTAKIEVEIPFMATDFNSVNFRNIGDIKWNKITSVLKDELDLPSPSSLPNAWAFRDFPRVIPPKWGSTAPPKKFEDDFLSGWQISDSENDFYVFFPYASGYSAFVKSFLKLTGNIPMLPKVALGFIYSRYHPFTDEQILSLTDKFKLVNMPLDIFVVDTNWREGASTGYKVNEALFPDMENFFLRAHGRGVQIIMNDHPEPVDDALSARELKFREHGLNSLIEQGLDYWWFDRNWKVSLDEPIPGLSKDLWGMRLYWDIISKYKRWSRTMILANAPGIRNGHKECFSGISAHRYPINWTGDTNSDWQALQNGIENAVNEGIYALMPYLSEDIGGHMGAPTPELYARFMQFAALSPIMRLHCTAGQTRDPWDFDDETERIATIAVQLRLKLIPMLYFAARKAFDYGAPLLSRCDIEWPESFDSSRSDQYIFCEDILVAPIYKPVQKHPLHSQPINTRTVFIPPGLWHDLWTGETSTGPEVIEVACPVWKTPLFARNGGIIITQPEVKNTSEQSWNKIIIDAFVPEKAGVFQRYLYEDDGDTIDYLDDVYSKTSFIMERSSDVMNFTIDAIEGSFRQEEAERSWILRFHLPPKVQIVSLWMDGDLSVPGRYSIVKFSGRPSVMPIFAHTGISGEKSSEVVEVYLTNRDIHKKIEVSFKLLSISNSGNKWSIF